MHKAVHFLSCSIIFSCVLLICMLNHICRWHVLCHHMEDCLF
uniref:Uncharacterized protein n=1 Tax=Anguilla anguilla TaxID=7936 RepID=A0A0E9XAE7_ANGAN